MRTKESAPSHIKIGAFRYQLILDTAAIDARSVEEGDTSLAGHCSPSDQTITVRPTQGPAQIRASVLHECVHALFSLVGASAWPGWGEELEELITASMEGALFGFLLDNPELLTWLKGD